VARDPGRSTQIDLTETISGVFGDPIEPGSRHLDELQPLGGSAHLACEREAHQHVAVGEPRDDAGLVARDDGARHAQAGPDRRLEGRREGAG
jgi:hypothetical protein